MHPSSIENMRRAINTVPLKPGSTILDVGGANTYYNQDRSYKHLCTPDHTYLITDIVDAPNVTHVMTGEYNMPFESESIDMVVCGQTLEHVNNPFKSVAEMKRVLKEGHFMCLCAPSAGPKHDNPDVWRFMDDAFKAIAKDVGGLRIIVDWVYREGNAQDRGAKWQDHTCVMQKIS